MSMSSLEKNLLTSQGKEKALSLSISEKRSVDRSPVTPYQIKISYSWVAPLYRTPLHVQVPTEPHCFTLRRLGLGERTQDVALASAFLKVRELSFCLTQ